MHADRWLHRGAGSDTTAIALTAWLYLVLTNQSAYVKLVTEIRGAFASHEDITWGGANDLPYLEACIGESLRMVPPVPGNLPRVVPPQGAMVEGKWVPGEVSIELFWTNLINHMY